MNLDHLDLMQDCIAVTGPGGLVKVELEWIGEGLDGDYDEDDVDDIPLLRFSVYERNNWPEEWEAVDDSSYCTMLSARIDADTARKAASQILNVVELPLLEGESIKKKCEKLSWISKTWLDEVSDEEDIT